MRCSGTGRLDVIEALLDRGAELEYETLEGKTALIHAASTGKCGDARLCGAKGARPSNMSSLGLFFSGVLVLCASCRDLPLQLPLA